MKTKIKDFFHFSRRDRNGIIVLLILICILIILRFFNVFENKHHKTDYKAIEKEIERFKDSTNLKNSYSENYNNKPKAFSIKKNKHHYVNNEKQNDFNYKKYSKENTLIELNSADSTDLIKIYGIGNVFSKRIVKYRDLLGGFYKIEQLKEVYGINDSIYTCIESSFIIDTNLIKKIDINTINELSLAKHPYLSKYDARAIIAFRKFKDGKIENIEELKKNKIIIDTTYIKVFDYLSTD